jgi:protein-tyrosine phosphatase
VQAELFTIERSGPGRLSTMAKPRGGDQLMDEIRALVAADVRVLVSLLSDAEVAELGLSGEEDMARELGLVFYRLPTPDFHVPDLSAGGELADKVRSHLQQDQGVAIHCRGGVGRSSTLAAIVLVKEGATPDQAWELITAARGIQVPETDAQRQSVAVFVRSDPG